MKQDTPAFPNNWSSWGEELSEEEESFNGAHGDEVHPPGMPEDHKFGTLMLCPDSIPMKVQKKIGCDYSIPGYEVVHITIKRKS